MKIVRCLFCSMDPPKEGFSMEQPTKRGSGRPRRIVSESRPSGESTSTLARPSTHGHRPSMSDWIGTITQAMVAVVGPSSISYVGRLKATQMMKTARRLGA